MKHKKQKKRSRKESTSDSSSVESSPQSSKKHKSKDPKHRKQHPDNCKDDDDDEYQKRHHKKHTYKNTNLKGESYKHKENSKHTGHFNKKDRHKSRERSSSPVKIKKEEDFDRRQDELRRKRRREHAMREERGHHHQSRENVHIKQEHDTDDNVRQRPSDGRRQRQNIEQERRQNDARRAEAWQQRERQGGGQNAEALIAEGEEESKEKEKPNLGLSGALTEDTNTFRGVVIKYNEPPEARVPKKRWRLYPFKGDEALKVLHLHRQSAYLLGKMRRIVDIPIDHPSCSKQHAVLQFRMVQSEKADGTTGRVIKPYIIDLDSANGTFVNNQKIEPRRYVELKEKDVIKFAYSSREYVLIHEKSDTTEVGESSSEDEDE